MNIISAPYETPAYKVRSFFADALEIPLESINLTARLRQDLKINGATGAELLEVFFLNFDIDFTRFRANDYFIENQRDSLLWARLLEIFGNARPLKTITISDLIHSLEQSRFPLQKKKIRFLIL